MRPILILALLWPLSATGLRAATVTVDCDRGETIGRALARISWLNRLQANTVNVRGTCVESVEIRNFERLTVAGVGAAAIRGPSDATPELSIANSQDVIVRDLTIGSAGGTSLQIANCQDCEVRGSTIEGLALLYGSGTALFFDDVLHANGSFAALGSYDHIRVVMVDCTVEPGSGWIWAGVNSESIIHLSGSTVRGFGVGIAVSNGAKLTLSDRQSLVPGSGPDATVVVENNAWSGVEVSGASTASIPVARIRNNGVGVVASGNSRVLTGAEEGFGPGAEISDNASIGVMVKDGAHADVGSGTRILRTAGNGLVVVNNSTAAGPPSSTAPATRIDGSTAQDVFCDATSIVSNAARIAATKVTCPNLNAGPHVPLPTQ
jgi:hypothetical protein